MLSVWSHAPHVVRLYAPPAAAGGTVAAAKTGTEPAETRAALLRMSREVEAGHLAVRARAAPLSATCQCHRRTLGSHGVEKKTYHGIHTSQKLTNTSRSRQLNGGSQRLASCVCRRWGFRPSVA